MAHKIDINHSTLSNNDSQINMTQFIIQASIQIIIN